MRTAVILASLLLLQQPSSPLATGRIEGIVLRGESMEPVSGARVTVARLNPATGQIAPTFAGAAGGGLGGTNAPMPQPPVPATSAAASSSPGPLRPPIPVVTTERDGRFVVTNLEEGTYRLTVTSNGYVPHEYGRRSFSGAGTPLKLGPGGILKDLVVRMTAAAAISGRVTDGDGQPAAGVSLQLVRIIYSSSGQRILSLTTRTTSNDRGEYRLYGITPGRYYLAGGTPLGDRMPLPADPYTFTYYPGTTDPDRAISIDVKPGSEGAFDLVVPRQPLYKLRGKIVDALAAMPAAVGLNVAFRTFGGGSGWMTISQSYDPATGIFELHDLPPGSYVVQVNTGAATARVPVQITNADIDNLRVVVSSGIAITGQVRMESGSLPPGTGIQLRPMEPGVPNFFGFAPQTQASADGTFRFDGILEGAYRTVITPPPGNSYVKAALFERSDVLNRPLELSASRANAPVLEIVLSPNAGQIEGTVVNERLQPLAGVQVVLVPDRNRDRTELFRSTTTDQSGRFGFTRVVPGDYRLFAWEALETNAYFDPEVLKAAEPQSKPTRVEESAKLEIQLPVIP